MPVLLPVLPAQALQDADRRVMSAGVELSDLQRQLAEARGERDASQVGKLAYVDGATASWLACVQECVPLAIGVVNSAGCQ